ncbi:MAG: uroporphyrinogen decarboxylase family protein [Candidatus Hodarchaeales archaeon]|jgi:uroporphyrinogen decarboxylase
MSTPDKYSILKAIMNQESTEKVPYSVWKHFTEADRTAEGLAEAQIKFQKEFDPIFLKVAPHGSYCVVDFGGILGGYRPVSGSRICERTPILSLDDWETLEPVDPNEGEFGEQIKAVKLINHEIEGSVPSVMTIFSPFMVASKLDPNLLENIAQDRKLLSDQLKMLTKLTIEFSQASMDAGADGLFLATQHFNSGLTPDDLQEFEYQHMESILISSQKKAFFNILHLHGDNPHFRRASELPAIHAINWHDQTSSPSLNEGRQDFTGALLGGFDEMGILRKGTVNEIEEAIFEVYKQFDGRGLIFAPGCVLPQDFADDQIHKVTKAVNALRAV